MHSEPGTQTQTQREMAGKERDERRDVASGKRAMVCLLNFVPDAVPRSLPAKTSAADAQAAQANAEHLGVVNSANISFDHVRDGCLVYSFGSRGDFSFENDLLLNWPEACEVP